MAQFFSERELGPRPLTLDVVPDTAWSGLVALFDRMQDGNLFAQAFPVQCGDGKGTCGTSNGYLYDTLRAVIPAFANGPRSSENLGAMPAMDLAEFGWRHAAQPKTRGYHSYYDHEHFAFDREAGRSAWRGDVNLILSRNGVALTLDQYGVAKRIDPSAARLILESPLPSSGDDDIDRKLQLAVEKYRNPSLAIRKEGLEALWDAYERIKSLLDPHKPTAIAALIARMTPAEAWRSQLDADFAQLTAIGNGFQIRHFEAGKPAIDDQMVDHLFVRTYSLLSFAVRALAWRSSELSL